jgi:hypothetical protein
VLSVEAMELPKIELQKSISNADRMSEAPMDGIVKTLLPRPFRAGLAFRILDSDAPSAAIAEFFSYLAGLIACTHHQAADALRSSCSTSNSRKGRPRPEPGLGSTTPPIANAFPSCRLQQGR